ncbi:glucose-6-phosphatase 3 [Drosophila tropicalis]|uniref:glucose-6-phosphatase 3 n=1 Tax=Drosophila tropicalis TaxID=46794 RepID=UPI0035ABED7D
MEKNYRDLATETYNNLLNRELHINEWAQERLSLAEPLWRFLSVFLEPGNLFNLIIPLAGIFSQSLLIHLVYVISLVSSLNSLTKWIYPETRPLWRLREGFSDDVATRPQVALASHELSCETSGGQPCAHSMSFTVLVLVLTSYLLVYCRRNMKWCSTSTWRAVACGLILSLVIAMWLSRLYLATEFLHQCILGSYFGMRILNSFEKNMNFLYSRRCIWGIILVALLIGLSVGVYFIKLHFGIDPHWSVRQAFKWCPEPTYMRHEGSPIFLLSRDFGNILGISLSLPITKLKSSKKSSIWRRCSVIGALELFNYGLRLATPKQYGRFAFLAYEFTRSALHCLALMKLSHILAFKQKIKLK